MVIPLHVVQYLNSESARQSALSGPMVKAYSIAYDYDGPLTEGFILDLANCFGFTGYRTIPVTFAAGGHASKARAIPGAMLRLGINAPPKFDFNGWYTWIKTFLQIHPFRDGNGRIASLLFNWAMNMLDEPFPLPYYKF